MRALTSGSESEPRILGNSPFFKVKQLSHSTRIKIMKLKGSGGGPGEAAAAEL